ncbi:NAD(P)-binding protein [Polyplosphaeria fusca]|uniref:NAD(P)-binding protein n=1 Tax=Polyplosphaeria fusca TaxID=682080 RepID=A0A9P4R3A9_9PLEO|nr:NAD(P)-binding protein [Polyplosphaeria fusca]
MAGELVFVTGGTGHVGYRTIVETLKAGYKVRAAVRSLAKGQAILDAPSVKQLGGGENVELVVVPDMLVPGAYGEAIKGATYAIHVASPLSMEYKEGDDMVETLVTPPVTGTLNILEAAKTSGTIKRIVITSSVVAIMPMRNRDPSAVYDETSRTTFEPPPYATSLEGYSAGKIMALNEAEAWIKRENPPFDLVHIFPCYIEGRDELATTPQAAFRGTNGLILGPVHGKDLADLGVGELGNFSVHIDDVALAHAKALDAKVPGNQGYVLSTEADWGQLLEIVAREFPEAVKSGRLPNNGKAPSYPINFRHERSEEVLGFKFQRFEEHVKSVVGYFLTLG